MLLIVLLIPLAGAGVWTLLHRGRDDVGRTINKQGIVSEFLWSLNTSLDADGSFPKGYKSSGEAFGALIRSDKREQHSRWGDTVSYPWDLYSSRNDAPKALAYPLRHKDTLSDDLVAYRYNQGLNVKDPKDLILLYARSPSRWMFDEEKMDHVGRTVLTVRVEWDFLDEDQFKERQARTLAFLKDEVRFAEADRAFEDARRAVKGMPGCFHKLLDRKKAVEACRGTPEVRRREDTSREERAERAVAACRVETGRLTKELAATSRAAEATAPEASRDPRTAYAWDHKLEDARRHAAWQAGQCNLRDNELRRLREEVAARERACASLNNRPRPAVSVSGPAPIDSRQPWAVCAEGIESTRDLIEKADLALESIEPRTLGNIPRRRRRLDALRSTFDKSSRWAQGNDPSSVQATRPHEP